MDDVDHVEVCRIFVKHNKGEDANVKKEENTRHQFFRENTSPEFSGSVA